MKKHIGLWIDHRKAVIVLPSDEGDEIMEILSHADRQPGRAGGVKATESYEPLLVPADDITDRRFTQHLNTYYDEVIDFVHEAKWLFIFGPGEAKGELEKRLVLKMPSDRTVDVESADKQTERQIVTKVRDFFKKTSPVILL